MSIVKTDVLAGEVGVIKAGDAVMVVQIVMVELGIRVMPQLVVTGDDRLMVVKHLEWLSIDGFAHAVESAPRPLFDRLIDGVIQRNPNKSAKLNLAAQAS